MLGEDPKLSGYLFWVGHGGAGSFCNIERVLCQVKCFSLPVQKVLELNVEDVR